jgi:TldD protein
MNEVKKPKALPYEDHFKITKEDLQKILKIALSRGGDFSEIFLEYRGYSFINMEEDIIKETAESISVGMGIRVLAGEKTGYGYTNDLSFEKMKRAALAAASIASDGSPHKSLSLKLARSRPTLYPLLNPAHRSDLKKKIDLVKQAYQGAQKFDAKITKVKAALKDSVQYMLIANSQGLMIRDSRPLIKLTCLAIAEKNRKREFGFSGGGGRVGLEYFNSVLIPSKIGQEAAQEALNLLDAAEAPAGEIPVVLSPGHAGVLVHEAVGHLLEADFSRKKTSIFWNKMGKKVSNTQVYIYDDPTIPHFRGSYNIDDEGIVPKKTLLIEKGIVVGLLQDRLSAKLLNMPLTGHGRREDFTFMPIPRMSNIYIGKGEYSPEEIIRSVKKGFYADQFQGGQVENSGKFTFSVSSGYLIENGKLTTPVKQATLIGSNVDILQKIELVGSDLKFSLQTGTCSKEGQDVPVTDGCPTIKIAKMTVGGLK